MQLACRLVLVCITALLALYRMVTFEMTNITLLERYIQKFIQQKDMVFSMLTALHISLITDVTWYDSCSIL